MTTSSDFELDDGTPVRFLLSPAEGAAVPSQQGDTPDGMGRAVPVGAAGRAVAALSAGALRGTLKPLGPLLQGVHDAVTATPQPPSDITVTLGVQVGQDLRLGIVGGTAQAHLTVTACWRPDEAGGGPAPGGSDG
ncbi:CU044_2847 family protein [Streptomyces sp. WMMC500]|uniref:CU044_2847 family protein n=1 Tax=Streptomyces sp. WMMC500 TaxID=3015154 RepID=UPI00248C0C7A|nr:CU044_2847 family protein [Streptomyces sp. WMMC500]WBB62439.1 CU044_2847 family protein [Streptomyces sp. WMMC500]